MNSEGQECPTWCMLAIEYEGIDHSGKCDPRHERERFRDLFRFSHLSDQDLEDAMDGAREQAMQRVAVA